MTTFADPARADRRTGPQRPDRRLTATAAVLTTLARHAWFVEDEVLGLADLVTAGDVCIDIGAEYGLYTLAMAARVGSRGQVHGIEPQPGAARVLDAAVRLVGGRGTVRTHRVAFAEAPRRDVMSVPRRNGLPVHGRAFLTTGASAPGPNATEFRTARWLPVEVTTLDAFCHAQDLDRVDFIKADVEGAELKVLRGGMRTLRRHRPAVQLEIEDPHIAKYGTDARAVVGLLDGLGYTMHVWGDGRWRPAERVTSARRNYLFVPRCS
jgi:FkbM family methyltransferase